MKSEKTLRRIRKFILVVLEDSDEVLHLPVYEKRRLKAVKTNIDWLLGDEE